MDEERLASLKEMEERLGYRFNEMVWLDQALTHKSYIHQTNTSESVTSLFKSILRHKKGPSQGKGPTSSSRVPSHPSPRNSNWKDISSLERANCKMAG
jgi:hypothetical protein